MFKKLIDGLKKLKDPYWKAQCKYIKYYENLPVCGDVILIQAYLGRKIDGNMFYILKYLLTDEKYKNYKIYLSSWSRYQNSILKKLGQFVDVTKVNIVTYSSDEYVKLLASAKYLFTDFEFPRYFIKKDGQIYTNTWHGTPLKTLGYAKANDKHILGNLQRNLILTDYLFNPNEYTNDIMIRDFELENLSKGHYIIGGYPRNEIFFDNETRLRVREELQLENKRIYAYLPTRREKVSDFQTEVDNVSLAYYLWEIDKRLNEDEIMFVNVHPLATNAVAALKNHEFKHIKLFPEQYETYVFLNIADVLLTDYSSVFFDFVCTGKKIVLFPYDKEKYLSSHGMYFPMDDLPFPQVFDAESVVNELRSEKNYDDSAFMSKFNKYNCSDASQKLCDYVILGEDTGFVTGKIPNNGKENVLIYGGGLAENNLTASLRALFNTVDLSKRNYYLSFREDYVAKNKTQIDTFNKNVKLFAVSPFNDMTVYERVILKLFNKGKIKANYCIKKLGKRFDQEYLRAYGGVKFDTVIHFSGYGAETIMHYSRTAKNNVIFVIHNMLDEIKKGKQRRDVLEYAYKNYNKVVTVSEEFKDSVEDISGRNDNIITVHNCFDVQKGTVKTKEPKFFAVCDYSDKTTQNLIDAFIKFHKDINNSYLYLCDNNASEKTYYELYNQILNNKLENNIILLNKVSSSYLVLKSCNYCICACYNVTAENILEESRVLKKPIVSSCKTSSQNILLEKVITRIGVSVDDMYNALDALYYGKPLEISNYKKEYNRQCIEEFEHIFETAE